MKHRPFDPLKLDVEAFASASGELDGEWPVATMDRLAALIPPEAVDAEQQPVNWSLTGEKRPERGSTPQTWLHLTADAALAMQCQRCLQPVFVPLDVASDFRFVADEATAEALDADSEEDILVIERQMNARALVEDELLLALPVVALHEVCPEPLPMPPDDEPQQKETKPNPFAALASLKRGTPS